MWGITNKSQHSLKFERCLRKQKLVLRLLFNWTKYQFRQVMCVKREHIYLEAFNQQALSTKSTLQNRV